MNTGAELGYYYVQIHNPKIKKIQWQLNPVTPPPFLSTPVGFTLTRQQGIRGSN